MAEWNGNLATDGLCASAESPEGKSNLVDESPRQSRFAGAVLPHLDAAYNLARWLTGNDHDAEDVVQEAFLRALRFFDGFRGGDGRTWLLTVVRNTCFTCLKRNRTPSSASFQDALAQPASAESDPASGLNPGDIHSAVHQALEQMPVEFPD